MVSLLVLRVLLFSLFGLFVGAATEEEDPACLSHQQHTVWFTVTVTVTETEKYHFSIHAQTTTSFEELLSLTVKASFNPSNASGFPLSSIVSNSTLSLIFSNSATLLVTSNSVVSSISSNFETSSVASIPAASPVAINSTTSSTAGFTPTLSIVRGSSSSRSANYTITDASSNFISRPASCYNLPTPTASLVGIPINATLNSTLPQMNVLMNENTATPQYIDVAPTAIDHEYILDFTGPPNQLGISVPRDGVQVLVNESGIFAFQADCSSVYAIKIPNFYAQLGVVDGTNSSSPPATSKLRHRSPIDSGDGLLARRDSSFATEVSVRADCDSNAAFQNIIPKIMYNKQQCPQEDCASDDTSCTPTFSPSMNYLCPITNSAATVADCIPKVADWATKYLQSSAALKIFNRIPASILELGPLLVDIQKLTKKLSKIDPTLLSEVVCKDFAEKTILTVQLMSGAEASSIYKYYDTVSVPGGFTTTFNVYIDQLGAAQVRCSCSAILGTVPSCTTVQGLCPQEDQCKIGGCPEGKQCLPSTCCGVKMCLDPATCDKY